MITGINHIGICVNNIEDAAKFFGDNLDAKVTETVEYSELGQISTFIELKDGLKFEVMTPMGEGGVVEKFLEKHGEGFHHISLLTDDFDNTVAKCAENGCRIIPGGEKYAFIHPKSGKGILYEICQEQ